jgi:hypothetical protein
MMLLFVLNVKPKLDLQNGLPNPNHFAGPRFVDQDLPNRFAI